MGIKNCLCKRVSFYEYTLKVITYMVMTDKNHSGQDIWQETLNQITGIEEIILII